MPAPKPILLQQNYIKDSQITGATISTTSATYINGQQNGSTKVVLVTSEPMEIELNRNGTTTTTTTTTAAVTTQQPTVNTNGTDEELTSLTWLHDKNLIKGINNISCPPNIKQHINNNNHLKIVNDTVPPSPPSSSPPASTTTVTMIKTHSKASSSGTVTPTSDDLIDDSGVSEDNTSSANSSSELGSIYSRPKGLLIAAREIETDDSDNNNSNAVNNKNRIQQLHHHHQPPPASSIIHLSPGGSTVIDTSGSMHSSHLRNEFNGNTIRTTNSLQSTHQLTSTTSTPHTHFHKKYIKAMQALNSNGTESSVAVVVTSASPCSIGPPNSQSSTIAITTSSPTIYTIPMKTTGYSPAKYEHETVIVENEYPHATITLASNQTTHHIYHGNDIDRHSDEYITPISSPRLQQQPAAPQKLSNPINLIAQSPPTVTISQQSTNSVPMPSVSPNPTQPKSANGVPYDPFIHTNNKPPLSFSSLIFLAIEDAKEKALPVKEIYAWIVKHYPYFKTAPTGWKNSVRHNLSLNKCFQKVEKAPNMGKGSLWRVEQQYKQNLIIALTRSSYHPNTSAMEKATASLKNTPRSPESPTNKPSNKRPLDADLFPRLSKYMAGMQNGNGVKINGTTDAIVNTLTDKEYQIHNGNGDFYHANGDGVIVTQATVSHSNHGMHSIHDNDIDAIETQRNVERIARDWGVDSIDDVNAATAMLALKHGPKIFTETFQTGTPIITSVPSEDHTYSAGGGGKRPTTGTTGVTTVINIVPNETESTVQFNGTNTPSTIPTTPHPIQNDTNHVINTINEVADNRHSDNISTSSDAAYESSEESQNDISPEELEARRHQEGVDAFLSFATEVSSMSSPLKRPPSADYVENVPIYSKATVAAATAAVTTNNNHIFANNNHNNGNYYYYDSSSSVATIPGHYSYLSSPSPPKKSRTRTLRTKLKKKTWIR